MTDPAKAKITKKKRGQGRPVAGKNEVGRERLLAAAEKLLRSMPPSKVTILRVAREANVDTALVHYYFGTRTELLLAVVGRTIAHGVVTEQTGESPPLALAGHIRRTVAFVKSANFMHRLMLEELTREGTEESRQRIASLNLDLVEYYRELFRVDNGELLTKTDPLYLHLLVLGTSDFFASAEPLIRALVPADTDFEDFTSGFQTFLVDLVLNGVLKR